MSYKDLLQVAWQGFSLKGSRVSHHPRKKGPGRFNKLRAHSRKFVSDGNFDCSGNGKRRSAASRGGNYQGTPYLAIREHDRCTRATFGLSSKENKDLAYRAELERVQGEHND